ncbi:glycosyltransferase family 1 protein [Ktedonosporobacter rubrisoli]|uniref:Glycosyltransferase family 1 protein n=1 Tax=Ktedonosporobacter rubrisoli TaxID=2509675 RepID=A0A4P6JSV9_KTERU|nr:glycosyltransferase [Ktedonosporobacter rubrisoli]QBD78332.1 glycosyltransferase family 1 protein [Ktedonosporobacter rubrisoli]
MYKPVRIAFLSEHASPAALRGGEDAGGQNVYVDEVSRNLARLGYSVDVFTRRDNAEMPEIIDWAPGVRVVNLTAGPESPLLKDDLWPYMPAFREAFLSFALRDEVSYELIHGNFWMSGWVAAELKQRLDVPVVQIFHAMGKTKRLHQGKNDHSPRARIAVETRVIRDVDRLIAQCPNELSELVDDYGADPAKIAVLPSAVNIEIFRPVPQAEARAFLKINPDEFVIVYVGRMLPRKDIRNVVRATALLLQRCPEKEKVRLLIVGGETPEPDPVRTPEIGELQRLASEMGIAERVQFVGKRQQDTLRYFYSAGDVVVTTPWYEPFGLTPLEGMACGRPVVGSAVGGITFTIKDGETGFLVPPRDPQALSERLYQLLCEPALRVSLGKAARERVEHEFTWRMVAARTAALYESLAMVQRPLILPDQPTLDLPIPSVAGR